MHRWRLRQAANTLNGSTLLGIALARLAGARVHRGPRGLLLGAGARLLLPGASAVTIGDVVVTRHPTGWLDVRPRLLAHEERHAWQYVVCLGLPMLPLYGLAAGWSWLRGGDPAVHNPFERRAGLEDGGYPLLSARRRRRAPAP